MEAKRARRQTQGDRDEKRKTWKEAERASRQKDTQAYRETEVPLRGAACEANRKHLLQR